MVITYIKENGWLLKLKLVGIELMQLWLESKKGELLFNSPLLLQRRERPQSLQFLNMVIAWGKLWVSPRSNFTKRLGKVVNHVPNLRPQLAQFLNMVVTCDTHGVVMPILSYVEKLKTLLFGQTSSHRASLKLLSHALEYCPSKSLQ